MHLAGQSVLFPPGTYFWARTAWLWHDQSRFLRYGRTRIVSLAFLGIATLNRVSM